MKEPFSRTIPDINSLRYYPKSIYQSDHTFGSSRPVSHWSLRKVALEVYQLHIIHFLNPAYSLLEILAVDVKAKTTHHSVANLIVHTDTDSQQLILVACCHHLHELQFLTVVYVYCATLADEFFCHLLIFIGPFQIMRSGLQPTRRAISNSISDTTSA